MRLPADAGIATKVRVCARARAGNESGKCKRLLPMWVTRQTSEFALFPLIWRFERLYGGRRREYVHARRYSRLSSDLLDKRKLLLGQLLSARLCIGSAGGKNIPLKREMR